MAGGLISGKRRRLEENKNQGGPLHQCNEPKGINEPRRFDDIDLEKGFEINQCWNEFNPQIRNIALKKGR